MCVCVWLEGGNNNLPPSRHKACREHVLTERHLKQCIRLLLRLQRFRLRRLRL